MKHRKYKGGATLLIVLNAFLLKVPKIELEACQILYNKETLDTLRSKYNLTHAALRQGEKILIFSKNGSYPVSGKAEKIVLQKDIQVFRFLVKDALIRHLTEVDREPIRFSPVNFISTKPSDNLLAPILGESYPFKIFASYTLDTCLIKGEPCLLIDCTTRKILGENCSYFINKGFDLVGRYVLTKPEGERKKLLGKISELKGNMLSVTRLDGQVERIETNLAYLEASLQNFDDYILHTHGSKKEVIVEKIRRAVSAFNKGGNKKDRIGIIHQYFQSKNITLIDGTHIEIEDALSIQSQCEQMQKPVSIFNDNGSDDWKERGLTQYGPYTKRTFDRNNPSICVICTQDDKGRVEQFVRKFLKGIPTGKYFKNGIEGKFALGTSRVEIFTVSNDSVNAYQAAIETAVNKKSEEGGQWDLALVQIRKSFKKLKVTENPYYVGKSLFLLHKIPVQDFTIELLSKLDSELEYSLNNMGLACYAKMGGVPWLLKSSPTLSHELVIGIGSANINQDRGNKNQRVMGITTVFSGDGSYIVSNTSKAVAPEDYCNALTAVVEETIEKIQKRMNWQQGDTIRLVFHAQVKKFNKEEIQAVRTVIDKYHGYQIEYAFLKISEDHGLHMFDSSTVNKQKGQLAPPRGKIFQLSKYQMLIYLIGQNDLRQATDGHPRGIIVDVHRDSTFKDIKYLSAQVYSFASHSWRSYFPNPMPVTISYSDLIAKNLGWLNQLPGWNDSVMIGKIGQSQWFL